MKEDFYPKLLEGEYYHIYNRGNNRENIFFSKENYRYFLSKYDKYLSPYLDTYAYCLLPNHFHLLVRVKSEKEFVVQASEGRSSTFTSTAYDKSGTSGTAVFQGGTKVLTDISDIISELFRRFFTSYAKSINKQEGRVGSLFQKNFKRKIISKEKYFRSVVHYIHANPQTHGICTDFKEYPYSSYQRMLMEMPSKLKKQELFDWFESKENFIRVHQEENVPQKENKDFWIED
jgi:putative transposase